MTNKKIQANNGKLLLGDALSVDHATGSVGIGTPSPGAPLHVSTTAGRIWLTDTSGGTDDKTAALLVSGGVFEINSRNDDGSTRVDNIFQADLGTGALTLGPSSGGGLTHVVQSNGDTTLQIISPSANDPKISFVRPTATTHSIANVGSVLTFTSGVLPTETTIGTLSAAGAWTLGASTNAPYAGFHTTYRNIASGTPSSAADLNGMWSISANAFWVTNYLPARVTGMTGPRIGLLPRTSDNTESIIFACNKVSDPASGTSSPVVGSITGAGAWELGPSGGANHTINGFTTVSSATTTMRLDNNDATVDTIDDIVLICRFNVDSTPTNGHYIRFQNAGDSTAGSIQCNGTNAVTFNTTSDGRYKINQRPIEYGLSEILQLAPKHFEWRDGNQPTDFGLIAQEVQPILPDMVKIPSSEEEKWQMDYSRLTPVLVKAIQELNAKVEAQAAEIEALKGI